jgi:predicted TIM-barrel fold metal-dependent hydrolase
VWGSDYPMLDPGRILDEFSAMDLGDKEDDILKNNAARLLGIEL